MAKIDIRRDGKLTSVAISDEHHALLLRIAEQRGEPTAARLLDAPLARARRGHGRQVAEAWIEANAPRSADERDRRIQELAEQNRRLEDHVARLEATVAARSAELIATTRRTFLLLAQP